MAGFFLNTSTNNYVAPLISASFCAFVTSSSVTLILTSGMESLPVFSAFYKDIAAALAATVITNKNHFMDF